MFSSLPPWTVARLVSRLDAEIPEARVCGILYERRPGKSFSQRCVAFVRQLSDWTFLRYAAAKIGRAFLSKLRQLGSAGLRFLHAYSGSPRGLACFDLDELADFCRKRGCRLHITTDMHAPESLDFVRGLEPDLALVYGTRILKPELFEIPRQGSINIHKRKVPDYRGGGPIGLWEILDDQKDIGVTVHRVQATLDTGAVLHSTTIPIEPFDTLTSLALKADAIGEDLLVRSVRDFMGGSIREEVQEGPARTFRTPSPQKLREYEKQIAARRPAYRPERGRPTWKLVVRTLLLGTWGFVRNWWRRLHGSFPVVVLYHHLVTDRPHCMGIPTELFLRHVEFLQRHYRVVDLSEALEQLKTGKIHQPTVVLTFDDGYGDNFLGLRAVTEATGVPVTMFICPDHVTRQEEFEHDRKWGLCSFMPLTWEQVALMDRSGITFGSHTRSHFDCGSSDPARLQSEIAGSRLDLEERLGRPIRFFSFPWGLPTNISPEAWELAKNTYSCVCSAHGGVNFPTQDGNPWHVLRYPHPNDLWELELLLQSFLERS
jgi:peptidoglycan/xylan/chitin deacetylase (PgdA/CDA1 family)